MFNEPPLPDHRDAELVLRVYELRREPVMRESREAINTQFWPKSAEDLVEMASKREHPLNAPLRQVGAYWEMVYGFAKHGIVPGDFLLESNGEGVFLYARVLPFIKELREATNPRSFQNTEWITTNTETGKQLLTMFIARVKKAMEKK
ncbi:MAG: hypothetical protein ABR543_16830 [Gemmatimonadaceae bacterium]